MLKVLQAKKDFNILLDYVKSNFGESAQIIKVVYKHQLINYQGHLCYITGEKELNNAVQLFVDRKYEKLLYKIEKEYIKELTKKEEETSALIKDFILHYNQKIRKHMPLYNNFAEKLDWILSDVFDKITILDKLI